MTKGDSQRKPSAGRQVEFELTCVDLPNSAFGDYPQIRLAIQRAKEVVDAVDMDAGQAVFRFSLQLKPPNTGDQPRFSGPYAHGKPADRFLYLCWLGWKDDGWMVFRRAKVPLSPVRWPQIEGASAAGQPLRATISMRDRKGGPVAATVPPDRIRWQT